MAQYFASHKDLNFLNPESYRIFKRLVEELQVGIFMSDSRGNLFYVNKTFADLYEILNPADVLGQKQLDVCFFDEACKNEFTALINKNKLRDYQVTHRLKNGADKFLFFTANHIYDDQGISIGIHGFVVDVTMRKKLEEEILNRNYVLEQIVEYCHRISDINDVNEMAGYVVEQTVKILKVKRCSIMFVDEQAKELYIKAAYGIDKKIIEETRVLINTSVSGQIVLKGKAVLVDDIENHDLFKVSNQKNYTQKAFMAAPLYYKNKIIGILNVSEGPLSFNRMDLRVLEMIAQQSSNNIYKTQMLANFEELSQLDPMTGLYNYRSFIERLTDEIYRSSRYGAPLSLMMVDVDHFKAYNDSRGHQAGDALLNTISGIFKQNLRIIDVICRYGGDEFIMILPQTKSFQAAIVADKIRELVSEEFKKENITLSIGIAELQKNQTRDDLIKCADMALYQSKRSGRNRVTQSHSKYKHDQP